MEQRLQSCRSGSSRPRLFHTKCAYRSSAAASRTSDGEVFVSQSMRWAMRRSTAKITVVTVVCFLLSKAAMAADAAVREQSIAGPGTVALKIRMEGPYTADVPLQV